MDDPQPYVPKDVRPLACRSCEYEPQETINNDTVRQKLQSQLELGMDILNLTGHPITVTTRLGERYTLYPRFDAGPIWKKAIFFTLRRRANDEVKVQPPYRSDSDTAQVATRAYHGLVAQETTGMHSSTYHKQMKLGCSLTLKELRGAGGRLYLEDLDVVVSLAESTVTDHHPYSRSAIEEYMALRWTDEASFTFRMYIVDNDRKLSSRYFNFNGKIYRIPLIYKEGVKDGVYVIHPPEVTSGLAALGSVRYDATYLTLTEAEEQFALYKSIADAETFGFSKEALAREAAQNQRTDDKAKILYKDEERQFLKEKWDTEREARSEERKWERERWEREQEVAAQARRTQDEKDRRDREADQRKAEAESEKRRHEEWVRQNDITQLRAKYTKELLVTVAGCVTTILTLMVAVAKATKSK